VLQQQVLEEMEVQAQSRDHRSQEVAVAVVPLIVEQQVQAVQAVEVRDQLELEVQGQLIQVAVVAAVLTPGVVIIRYKFQ
jgi:hypothetical protein